MISLRQEGQEKRCLGLSERLRHDRTEGLNGGAKLLGRDRGRRDQEKLEGLEVCRWQFGACEQSGFHQAE
jgi:hypothetical protein